MTMKKFDREFEEQLEKTIEAIEEKTSVEVVVAIAPSSDGYVDTYYKGGLAGLLIVLAVVLYSPFVIPEMMVPVDLALAFFAGMAAVKLFPGLRRLLVSGKRKNRYVETGAHSYFRENNLDETIERTAFLVYVSAFERTYKIIADKGVLGCVPEGVRQEIQDKFDTLFTGGLLPDRILQVLPCVTGPFSQFMPPFGDNPDEICNRLRRVTW